jgi:hypothetical protein
MIFWGALSDERKGLSFVYAVGPCQSNLSRVRVPWDSRQYFTLSDLRLPFSSPPTTRRLTVEIFDPASIWVRSSTEITLSLAYNISAPITLYCCVRVRCLETTAEDNTENTVLLLLSACMSWALPSNGHCIQSHRLATGLYATLLLIFLAEPRR